MSKKPDKEQNTLKFDTEYPREDRNKDSVALTHILEALNEVMELCKGLTYATFFTDIKLLNICAKEIFKLSGYMNHLSGICRKHLPEIDWEKTNSLCDKILNFDLPADFDDLWEFWGLIGKDLRTLGRQCTENLRKVSTHPAELTDKDIVSLLQAGYFVELTEKESRDFKAQFKISAVPATLKDEPNGKCPNYFLCFCCDENLGVYMPSHTINYREGMFMSLAESEEKAETGYWLTIEDEAITMQFGSRRAIFFQKR